MATSSVSSPSLPAPRVLGHLSVGQDGPLELRVALELAQNRPAQVCVPLLLQQDAVRAMRELADALDALAEGATTPEQARQRAAHAIHAWNTEVGTAHGLLQTTLPPARRRWWSWFMG